MSANLSETSVAPMINSREVRQRRQKKRATTDGKLELNA